MINGYVISYQGRGWEFAYAADNPKTGHGEKFYTREAAEKWCLAQSTK